MNLGTVIVGWSAAAVISTAGIGYAGYWTVNKLADAFRNSCTMTPEVLEKVKPGDRIMTNQGKCALG
ncbi:MAG: hypothetical protein WC043_07165 [Pseudobdellovibrionaceae bacterium]